MAPNVLADEQALYALAKSYPEAFLFVGYSEKALFESVDGAVEAISPYLQAAEKRCSGQPFLMVYGGDPAHVPTIGAVVKTLQQKHKCHVLALQASGKHEDWVDHVFICQEQFEVVKKVVDGKEVEVKETLWGGTRNGVPVGGARYYMGPEFYGRPPHVPGAITLTFFLGGGGIAAEELQFADEYGAPWVYIPCPAKNVAAYGGHFGPVHDYVVKKLASGEGKHLALFGNRPAQS
mmetsp:Transcript_26866/g.72549  ORF Transcript_26866/g.72549 Transcript_26866/m.72549 type:complete len:235 (+) Transcript_26866:64-768(+)